MALKEKKGFFDNISKIQEFLSNPVCGIVGNCAEKLADSYAGKVKSDIELNNAKAEYYKALTKSLNSGIESNTTKIYDLRKDDFRVKESV